MNKKTEAHLAKLGMMSVSIFGIRYRTHNRTRSPATPLDPPIWVEPIHSKGHAQGRPVTDHYVVGLSVMWCGRGQLNGPQALPKLGKSAAESDSQRMHVGLIDRAGLHSLSSQGTPTIASIPKIRYIPSHICYRYPPARQEIFRAPT
jgi:hypothetical protein